MKNLSQPIIPASYDMWVDHLISRVYPEKGEEGKVDFSKPRLGYIDHFGGVFDEVLQGQRIIKLYVHENWVREKDLKKWSGYGEDLRPRKETETGKWVLDGLCYSMDIQWWFATVNITDGIRAVAMIMYTYLRGKAITSGTYLKMTVNQSPRECEVIDVKRSRFRIEYEMPNCTNLVGAWRYGMKFFDRMFFAVRSEKEIWLRYGGKRVHNKMQYYPLINSEFKLNVSDYAWSEYKELGIDKIVRGEQIS